MIINLLIQMIMRYQRKKGSQHIRKAPITTPRVTNALCSFKTSSESPTFCRLCKLNTFRQDEFMRRLSFITGGEEVKVWDDGWVTANLRVYSRRTWQKLNFWRASLHPLWSSPGWCDPAPPECSSETHFGSVAPSHRRGSESRGSADLASTSHPPSEAPPPHAEAVFFASCGIVFL